MALSPIDTLNAARRVVPVVNYALAAAGVAAACNLAIDFVGRSQTSFLIFGAIFVAMLLLVILGRLLKSKSSAVNLAAIMITWAVALFFIAFLTFTTTAAAFYWPHPWARFIGMSESNALIYTMEFNCLTDRSVDEQIVCRTETLSKKDVLINSIYQVLKLQLPPDKFKPIQNAEFAWLGKRRACGELVDCIERVYDERIS